MRPNRRARLDVPASATSTSFPFEIKTNRYDSSKRAKAARQRRTHAQISSASGNVSRKGL